MKLAVIALIATVVYAGDDYSPAKNHLAHHKCRKGDKVHMPFEDSEKKSDAQQKQTPSQQISKAATPQSHHNKTEHKTVTYSQAAPSKEQKQSEPLKVADKKAAPASQAAPNKEKKDYPYQLDTPRSPSKVVAKTAPKVKPPKMLKKASKKASPKTEPKGLSSWEAECFNRHNEHRRSLVTDKGESVVEFTWRKDLAVKAQYWANKLAKESQENDGAISLRHSDEMDWNCGENLYSTKNGNQTCACATDAWFNEWPLYSNQKIPEGDFKGYGHYTQLAWPDTKFIGCAYAKNGDNIRFTVCEYDPPGNYAGERLNVFVKGKQGY